MEFGFTRRKIALIGAGQIGGILALLSAQRDLGNIVLIDKFAGVAQGKALDLQQMMAIIGKNCQITGSGDFSTIENADICIVTAGFPRKPNMSRDELVTKNTEVIKEVGEAIKRYAPQCIVIVITNPLDAMAHVIANVTGFAKNRVVGMAGILDAGRFRTFLSMSSGISPQDIDTLVLGGHGDTMVALPSYSQIAGLSLTEYPQLLNEDEKIENLVARTRDGGAEIVGLLKTGSAFFSPAAAGIAMAEAILHDQKRIFPCSAYCQGEYGESDVYLGVPVILGGKGVERILEVKLSSEEKTALAQSAQAVRKVMALASQV